MNQRVLKLMERLALDQCEAVLVHNPSNMFYLSGYTGEGLVLIGREMQAIITDFRYTEQAEKQALEQEKQMQKTIIGIKKRFGKNAILKGMNFQEGATARERNEQVGGHKA